VTAPPTLRLAVALALGAAISLGIARFSYALLLPAMRADLGWSYFTAGAMNTANAAGYLTGALLLPRLLTRYDARRLLLAGGYGTVIALALHGAVRSDAALYLLRFLAGTASAATFVSGGLMAARLGAAPGARPALVLGIYYGGTGIGIIASALLVPPLLGLDASRGWAFAWWALAAASLLATLVMGWGSASLAAAPVPAAQRGAGFRWRDFGFGLAGYLLFGLGYIGYMTFIVTLLRAQGVSATVVVAFYVLLGVATIASSWLWAPLLQRYRGGQPLALLNALMAVATVLPVWSTDGLAVFVSGALFGAVFLSVVASTTALVRHNVAAPAWPAGIGAFTIVFAAGQIVGPSLVGWVADGAGGLQHGLAVSAAVLAVAALLAWRQRPLPIAPGR